MSSSDAYSIQEVSVEKPFFALEAIWVLGFGRTSLVFREAVLALEDHFPDKGNTSHEWSRRAYKESATIFSTGGSGGEQPFS
jgi:hypothetical protein